MSIEINLVFPNQLFKESPLFDFCGDFYLIEEYLYFRQYKFHKQKIAFHRASMKHYQAFLEAKGKTVHYIESADDLSDILKFSKEITNKNITTINVISPSDDWLETRLRKISESIKINFLDSPQFINNRHDLKAFFDSEKKSYFQTAFYKQERARLHILIGNNDEPTGGKWTFDSENRKKYPKTKTPPSVYFPEKSDTWTEAVDYTENRFNKNLGSVSPDPFYPISHAQAEAWFGQFLD